MPQSNCSPQQQLTSRCSKSSLVHDSRGEIRVTVITKLVQHNIVPYQTGKGPRASRLSPVLSSAVTDELECEIASPSNIFCIILICDRVMVQTTCNL